KRSSSKSSRKTHGRDSRSLSTASTSKSPTNNPLPDTPPSPARRANVSPTRWRGSPELTTPRRSSSMIATSRILLITALLIVGSLAAAMPALAGPSAAKVRLGAFLEVPEETLASQLDLPKGRGLVVRQVIADSAAAKAGLQPFDILLELNGQAVSGDVRQFCFAIEQAPDTPITAVVLRMG